MIKVANLIEEGRYGGPQVRIVAVAERLKSRGVKTVIICPDQESERFYEEAVRRGIGIRRINIRRLSRKLAKILRYFLTFPKEVFLLVRLLKKENVDIVHCNSARQFKGVMAGRLAGKKVIWHLQDTWSPFVIKFLFSVFAFLPHYFIASGERVRQYYLSRFPFNRKPMAIIRQPVDTLFFHSDKGEPDELIAASNGLNVVSVGNINPAKGFEFFLESIICMSKLDVRAKFWLVGPYIESQKKYYKKIELIAQKIPNGCFQFYGPSNNVRSVLKAVDIFVCSSLHESGPITLWEAMSMGKAVVSTDVGDVRLFIQDGVNGFIVTPRAPKALADKIGVLLKNANLRQLFGARARSTAIRHLDISICTRKHAEVYREILKK